jgi:hypothetical protein
MGAGAAGAAGARRQRVQRLIEKEDPPNYKPLNY